MNRNFRLLFSVRTFAILMAIVVAMQVADRQKNQRATAVPASAVALKAGASGMNAGSADNSASSWDIGVGSFSFSLGGGRGPAILF